MIISGVESPAPRSEWREIAATDPAALADHGPDWADAATASGRWRDASRLYRLADGRRIVLPLLASTGRVSWYSSQPNGRGFGGLIGDGSTDAAVVRSVLADLAEQSWTSLRVRPDPQTGTLWSSAAPPHAVHIARRAHVLDLSPGPDRLRAAMSRSARRAIRRGERGDFDVEVTDAFRCCDEYHRLWRLSVDRWARNQREPLWLARRRAAFRDPPTRLRDLAATLGDNLRVWIARDRGDAIAANVVASGRGTHVIRAVMDRERIGSSGVMQYLDWLAIEAAATAGSSVIHLGESGTSATLAHYKESLGATPHDYNEIRMERWPISRVDSAVRGGVKRAIGFSG